MSINTNNTIGNAINSYQSQVVKKNETAANKAKTTEDTAAKKAAEKKTETNEAARKTGKYGKT
ncbi:MAG: hypothetical protein IK054_07055, partial [Lachnospiraceae bacterium]|nr:hypothetical protein [Lachnospiraceae bacterium]